MTLDDVIKGLAYCQETNGVPSSKCLGCPFWNCYNCTYVLRAWAINSLKSMKKPKEENIWDNGRVYCWQCGKKLPKKKGVKYCAYCGQAVEMND